MSIGIVHIACFPVAAYYNGGGSFLFAYIITVVFITRPLYILESTLGQFSGLGSYDLFGLMAPALSGI